MLFEVQFKADGHFFAPGSLRGNISWARLKTDSVFFLSRSPCFEFDRLPEVFAGEDEFFQSFSGHFHCVSVSV